ncbi:hypothetical protein KAFR_0C03040 [Kazachstania africana CBS 2517]|uniref:Uncharacterized protein n=1 Tax=Kazachstania africana (strain ATCC 22294 / BCRC 22015 / CBS 2517 / CECT 1963 / NBRC 1671 / NRRL Y-8276) TaxID=1071382 RepID=H2ASE7_KAZAF|nr:hypothetical protein KAFR_0C03040 [Kazachstania africana CBS 2517]CCF57297.1 hypothetical protein KAFR_0C03040 [Kazachstania africana CBS 2517]
MPSDPPELPGFYFDIVRKRYFPVNAASKGEAKRQKVEISQKDEIADYWDKEIPKYYKALWNNEDTEKLRLVNDHLERAASSVMRLSKVIFPINLNLHAELFRRKILSCVTLNDEIQLLILDNGEILKVSSDGSILMDWNPLSVFGVNNLRMLTPKVFWESNVLYIHYFDETITCKGIFCQIDNVLDEETLTPRIFFCNSYTKNSISLINRIAFSVDNKISLCFWNNTELFTEYKLGKAQITCLEVFTSRERPTQLYAGSSDGTIHCLPIKNSKIKKKRFYTLENVLHVTSIVSLLSAKDGSLYVSALKKESDSQCLYKTDPFLADDQRQKVTVLKTKIINYTKDTELFSTSPDGKYICYGKKYTRDFEIFSIFNVDDKSSQDMITNCYPIGNMNDFISLDTELSEYSIFNIEFIRPSNSKEMKGLNVDGDTIEIISNFRNINSKYRVSVTLSKETELSNILTVIFDLE